MPQPIVDQLQARPGAWYRGTPRGLLPWVVLNDEDFVYDIKPSRDSTRVVLSRLGAKSFDVLVWELATEPALPKKVCEGSVNLHEFDVETADFSPDGKWVAVSSRDRSVKVFDAATCAPVAAWLTESPLTTLAFHPSGAWLAVGSEGGFVTALKFDARPQKVQLRFAAEARAHQGQVRGLAFAPDGRLFSGGWDKTVAVFATEVKPVSTAQAQVHFERKGGFAQLRGTLGDKASVLFALDARMPHVVMLRSELAQAVGIDPLKLTDTVNFTSSFGSAIGRVAHGLKLSFKSLVLENLDAVVCDACIPADAQAVLGQGFLEQVELGFDDTHALAVLKRKGGDQTSEEPMLTLAEATRFTFPAFVNDLSVDGAGKVLGVALSEAKGERTREVYEREKRGDVEPEREWDVGARVDAATGAVLQKLRGHRGVVSTAAISPDGLTLATGGWDKKMLFHREGLEPQSQSFGWALRRLRYTPDGRWLLVAAWTPQNVLGDHKSDVSSAAWEVSFDAVELVGP